ncbi:tripartite tricarboxylate transporter permease [Afifella sp. IM 167]|uniref:tripartite tricarboxylate transporter permease n=1 Tax=Afifella sp. IM 167 TaxID=2033586 RepID=UPI001CCDC267|nr:tripartite tricarboxylate transporter permease [Afifella sp. IM 167]MBZ8133845.1 C4-dicarboxylate ABC transporter permease [Afifella sp. IM 167]
MPGFDHFIEALTPLNLAFALFGVMAGTVIGSIPGLTATMAVAVLVPLTFTLAPASALILLGAIYTGAIYGGAYSAILLNTPGTPSAIATTFDGYPMARKGDGDLAVTLACLASVCGGLVGALFLLTLAPPLSRFALAFGPVEYFWLAIFGLSLIAALSEGSLLKGIAGGALGLLLSTIGVAEVSADVRLTFGAQVMIGGIQVVAALIGLYCIPVLIDLVATPDRHLRVEAEARGFRLGEAWRTVLRNKVNLIRSSVIGTLVGVLPGAGGSVAGLVAYSEARRTARKGEEYGKGEPGGVLATESANNATVGGGFIPTLVLGIPGTPPDAVILGALLVQGVRTGPQLFEAQGAVVYTFIWGLFLATILMLPAGLLIGRYAYKTIVTIPKAMLVPAVAFMTVIGTYAIRNNSADVTIMVVLGAIGWALSRFGFGVSPIVLGLILGPIAEQGFVQAWTIGTAIGDVPSMFFGRPISLAIIAFTLLSLFWPFVKTRLGRWKEDPGVGMILAPTVERGPVDIASVVVGLILAGAGIVTLVDAAGYTDPDSAVFPRAVAIVLIVASLGAVARALFGIRNRSAPRSGSTVRRVALLLVMLAAALLLPWTGFLATMLVAFMAIILIAMHDPWTPRRAIIFPLAGILTVVAFTALFRYALYVPLPEARLF